MPAVHSPNRRDEVANVTDEYRIPTQRLRVELLLTGQETMPADLYLGEQSERDLGPERPLDILNGKKSFFPAKLPEDGTVLVRRTSVLMASLPAAEARENDPRADELLSEARSEESDAREVDVQVVLDDGTRVTGTVAYVLPRGERRLQDFLNNSETFFRVWDGEFLRLVNGDRAVTITARSD